MTCSSRLVQGNYFGLQAKPPSTMLTRLALLVALLPFGEATTVAGATWTIATSGFGQGECSLTFTTIVVPFSRSSPSASDAGPGFAVEPPGAVVPSVSGNRISFALGNSTTLPSTAVTVTVALPSSAVLALQAQAGNGIVVSPGFSALYSANVESAGFIYVEGACGGTIDSLSLQSAGKFRYNNPACTSPLTVHSIRAASASVMTLETGGSFGANTISVSSSAAVAITASTTEASTIGVLDVSSAGKTSIAAASPIQAGSVSSGGSICGSYHGGGSFSVDFSSGGGVTRSCSISTGLTVITRTPRPVGSASCMGRLTSTESVFISANVIIGIVFAVIIIGAGIFFYLRFVGIVKPKRSSVNAAGNLQGKMQQHHQSFRGLQEVSLERA